MTSEDAAGAEQASSGIVYLDWVPHEGRSETSQRIDDVERVEVRPPEEPDGYDEGELVLHRTGGVGVFDRNSLRGFRAREGVAVPEYERTHRSEDSGDSGGEV